MGITFFYMMFILKIPIVAALILIWYAVREPAPDGGEDEDDRRRRHRHDWPPEPRTPRRGPSGGALCKPSPCPQVADARARLLLPASGRRSVD